MGTVRSINSIDQFENTEALKPGYNMPVVEAKKSLSTTLSDDSPENKEKMKAIDKLQLALDWVWLEQTIGTAADVTNTIISALRALLATESDERKKHILNMGISAVSILPAGDVAKALKLRKYPKLLKGYIKWVRWVRKAAKTKKIKWDRFVPSSSESNLQASSESNLQEKEIYLDPYQHMAEDDQYYAKAA